MGDGEPLERIEILQQTDRRSAALGIQIGHFVRISLPWRVIRRV